MAQLMRPAVSVKVPALQALHVRSLLAVASAVVYLPAKHGLLTAPHTDVPPMALNVTPTWHGVHVLSDVFDPAA